MKTEITVTTNRLERGMQNQKRAYYALSDEEITISEAISAVQDFLDETNSTVKFEYIGTNAHEAEGMCFNFCHVFNSTNL